MSTLFLTQLWRSQLEPYQRVAWFLFEAAEREQRLNIQAMLETSTCFPCWFSLADCERPFYAAIPQARQRSPSRVA